MRDVVARKLRSHILGFLKEKYSPDSVARNFSGNLCATEDESDCARNGLEVFSWHGRMSRIPRLRLSYRWSMIHLVLTCFL